jgi:hypothetical protein
VDLADFSGRVPVFPLPNVVLLPQAVLPLHIFEPRYREMTERALEGERLIAMALLKPGWEPEYYGNPAIHDVIGVGRIVHDQRLSDGRFNLLLQGLCRARVIEVISDRPYRTASVELLEDALEESHAKALESKRQGLLSVYTSIVRQITQDEKVTPDPSMPLGMLCDALAAFVEAEPREKQAVLEELDVAARTTRVVELLRRAPIVPKRPWPPQPSQN